jgi:uncharacterized protein YyaL (SSP411 family)
VKNIPQAYSKMVTAFLYSTIPGKQIVIAGRKGDKDTESMLNVVNKRYLPFTTVIFNDGSEDIHRIIPFVEKQEMINNKATAYVCENFTCSIPTTDIDELIKKL